MQYFLIDPHQRFLGTLFSSEALAVGDTIHNHNDQNYTIVGLNWSRQHSSRAQSLTVIPVQLGSHAFRAEQAREAN